MIWLGIAACVLLAFVYSGLEAGLLSVSRVRLHHYARAGEKAALKLQKLLARPDRLLVTLLVALNLSSIFAVVMSTRELVTLFGRAGYWIAFLVWLPLYLLVIQLFPKSLFRRFPYRALAAFAELLRVTSLVLSPLVTAGAGIGALIVPQEKRRENRFFVAREDVKYFISESESVGTLSGTEREMIHNIVDFRAVSARDVMVPMAEVRAVREEAPVEELFRLSRETNLDRLPVLGKDGAITGLVNVFDALLEQNPRAMAGESQRRIVTVRPEEPAYNVIRKLRASRTSVAAVMGKDATPIGIVSSEDLIRRLVSAAVPESEKK